MLNYCANGPSGYNLTNSLRFRRSASAYLNRTPASASNRKTWTYSAWIKRGQIGAAQVLFSAGGGASPYTAIYFQAADDLVVEYYSAPTNYYIITSQLFRDPSAWYHIVVVWDTTQATSSNRIKIYVNGNQVTSFSTAIYPAQNTDGFINNNTNTAIGSWATVANTFDGYYSEINFIDGQALTPSSFGSTNSTTGVWQPAKYTGTYGTNGFYLPFSPISTSTYAGSFSGSQNLQVAQNSAFDLASSSWTIEGWYLWDGNTSDYRTLFAKRTGGTGSYQIYVDSGNTNLKFWNGSTIYSLGTMPINSWTHIAAVHNGTTLTIYMNGVSIYSNSVTISNITSPFYIGFSGSGSGEMFTGNISNFRLVKGTAVYTSNFAVPTSALTNISGTSLLTLQNATIIDNSSNAFSITNNGTVITSTAYPFNENIFADKSGNNNNWIGNNIQVATSTATTYDSMTDVPTLTSATVANYGTWNPLNAFNTTTTDGNLGFSMSANNTQSIQGTFGMTSGKWYFEYSFTSAGVVSLIGGIVGSAYSANGSRPYTQSTGYMYISNGNKINAGSGSAYGSTYTTNDIIGVAVDLDNGKIWFSKNGTWQASGDPAAGTNPAYTGLSGSYVASVTNGNDGVTYAGWINCGQRPFSYTAPTGFLPLNTYNLPTSTIVQGNKYMDATTYTGNGGTLSVTNAASFQPDLVWVKGRSNGGTNNLLTDVLRGNKGLFSNLTEGDSATRYCTLLSNGFQFVGTAGDDGNTSGWTYVGWQWKANGAGVTNTSGSITSTVSVNASAGFSVVTYTGNLTASPSGGNDTVGHGLGVAPKMIIFKRRDGTSSWIVWHTALSGVSYVVQLNATAAEINSATAPGWLGGTPSTPTSTIFGTNYITGRNVSGQTQVAYCWAEIAGFSKFTSYTGNGSTDGPFVYCGFRPKWIMFKRTDSSLNANWMILDTSRNTYNVADSALFANLSNAELTSYPVDILSNGFKIRGTTGETNVNGGTYIIAAFAENPFKNALAR